MIPKPSWSWLVLLCTGFLGFAVGSVAADEIRQAPVEQPPAAGKAVSQLVEAYSKLEGFVATYRGEAPGKSLTGTLAADFSHGLAAIRLSTEGEAAIELRQWTLPNDRLHVANGPHLLSVKGLGEQVAAFGKLFDGMADKDGGGGRLCHIPFLVMEKSTIGAGLATTSKPQPPWLDLVKGASVESSDEESVVFRTADHGLLTISREHGMLLRQSLAGEAGEARVLKLAELRLNPGRDEVLAISADWPTAGATESGAGPWLFPLRTKLLQKMVDRADEGRTDAEKLESSLEVRYDALRHFAAACIEETKGRIALAVDWAKLFQRMKSALHDRWLATTPGADLADEDAFRNYLSDGKTRLELRNSLVKSMMDLDKLREPIMAEMFGPGGAASVQATTARGRVAKQVITTALVRSYLEELIDRQMEKQWDRRDWLD